MADTYVNNIDLKDIVFANSQQHISIDHRPDGLGERADSMTLSIYIWGGDKASVPATPQYTLKRKALDLDVPLKYTYSIFKIDEFLSSEITNAPVLNGNNSSNFMWFKVVVQADTSAQSWDSGVKLVTNGWGDFNEGANPGISNTDLNGKIINLGASNNITSNVTSRLTVYTGEGSTNEKISKTSFANGQGTTDLVGIKFNGVDSYMNLGKVPLLNSGDSYVSMKFKATNWSNSNPFGYVNIGEDKFQVNHRLIDDIYGIQTSTSTTVNPSNYPTPDNYQDFVVFVDDFNALELEVEVYGLTVLGSAQFTPRATSGIDFYIGARNNGGVADNFTEVIFTELEFFNGVDTKTFNHANNWNGAVNYGGVLQYSSDNGVTWSDTPSDMIQLTSANTNSFNQFQVLDDLELQPTSCVNDGYTLVYDSDSRVDYPYDLRDIKDQGYEIVFFGKCGCQLSIGLFGRLKPYTNYERSTYSNVTIGRSNIYTPSEHTIKTLRNQSYNSFSLHTGVINYEQIDILKQLLESEIVWIKVNDDFIPIVVETKQIQWGDDKYGVLHNYDVRFKYANPNINKVG